MTAVTLCDPWQNRAIERQALAGALFDNEGGGVETLLDEATLQELFGPLIGLPARQRHPRYAMPEISRVLLGYG